MGLGSILSPAEFISPSWWSGQNPIYFFHHRKKITNHSLTRLFHILLQVQLLFSHISIWFHNSVFSCVFFSVHFSSLKKSNESFVDEVVFFCCHYCFKCSYRSLISQLMRVFMNLFFLFLLDFMIPFFLVSFLVFTCNVTNCVRIQSLQLLVLSWQPGCIFMWMIALLNCWFFNQNIHGTLTLHIESWCRQRDIQMFRDRSRLDDEIIRDIHTSSWGGRQRITEPTTLVDHQKTRNETRHFNQNQLVHSRVRY